MFMALLLRYASGRAAGCGRFPHLRGAFPHAASRTRGFAGVREDAGGGARQGVQGGAREAHCRGTHAHVEAHRCTSLSLPSSQI